MSKPDVTIWLGALQRQTVALHHVLKVGLLKRGICENFHAIDILNVHGIIGNACLKAQRIFQPTGIFPREIIKNK